MTLSEQIIEHLKENGSRELNSNSRRYRKFTNPKNPDKFYWVGKKGAVLSGKTVKDSFSITDLVKQAIQNKEREK